MIEEIETCVINLKQHYGPMQLIKIIHDGLDEGKEDTDDQGKRSTKSRPSDRYTVSRPVVTTSNVGRSGIRSGADDTL
jgi:hypothetical protein